MLQPITECLYCGNDSDEYGDDPELCVDCNADEAFAAHEELRYDMAHDDF